MILEPLHLHYGGKLVFDATIIGTYEERDEETGRTRTRNKYELNQVALVVDASIKQQRITEEETLRKGRLPRQPDGILKVRLPFDFPLAAKRLEIRDQHALVNTYNLSVMDQQRLRAATHLFTVPAAGERGIVAAVPWVG